MPSRLWVGVLLSAALCASPSRALAQTGFPDVGRGIGPSTAEVVGAIVGAAVVIVVVVYLVIPKQKTIEGCVESGGHGLQLTDDRTKRTYALAADIGSTLQTGRRVRLKGKPGKKKSGIREFAVRRVIRDEGGCSERPKGASLRRSTVEAAGGFEDPFALICQLGAVGITPPLTGSVTRNFDCR
jgi:hypothetical protein